MQQVNGGSVEDKVDFAYNLFEQTVSVDSVFQPNEMLDTIAITKGKGTEGVVTRWGVTRLPRKTHRGLRKVSLAYFMLPVRQLVWQSNGSASLLLFTCKPELAAAATAAFMQNMQSVQHEM